MVHIYWIRRDFRLGDNPALIAAVTASKKQPGDSFIPMFVLDDAILNDEMNIGAPRRKSLARILSKFSKQFKNCVIACGKPVENFQKLAEKNEIIIYANEDVEPYARQRDIAVKKHFSLKLFRDSITVNKDIKSGSGSIYSVFTPFKKATIDEFLNTAVFEAPNLQNLTYYPVENSSFLSTQFTEDLESKILSYVHTDWVCVVQKHTFKINQWCAKPDVHMWPTDEEAARARAEHFVDYKLADYAQNRDNLELEGTSQLSMVLKWGLLSARQLKELIIKDQLNKGAEVFLSELMWREFYRYILWHYPQVLDVEFRTSAQNIHWVTGDEAYRRFELWMRGETGFQIVDAAMHQLNTVGWMHNRSRMIVSSFLTKHLGVDWRWGQEYFRATLFDLDEASNNGGWQWGASVGADPKPIRIFNPYIQQDKFDPGMSYRNKWLPKDYTIQPIISHEQGRDEAKARYALAKAQNEQSLDN
jgi:deoxyribodipyrimidine photo-lyase